jgi:hypothetical protein
MAVRHIPLKLECISSKYALEIAVQRIAPAFSSFKAGPGNRS